MEKKIEFFFFVTFQEWVVTILNDTLERSMKGVIILLDKLGRLIANSSGEVPDEKSLVVANFAMIAQFGLARESQSEVIGIGRVHRRGEVRGTRFGQFGFFVEQVEDAAALRFD